MGKRPKRKVVLFLVEGDSERMALQDRVAEFYDSIDESIEVFFPELFTDDKEEKDVRIETGGDITQSYDVYPGNYDEKVYEFFLRDFFELEHLFPKDITEVVQLLDMDGAYIENEQIKEVGSPPGETNTYYSDSGILAVNKKAVEGRHKRKRTNVDYIKGKTTITIKQKTVPFSAYYFSCNLDHFLHNQQNMPGRDKKRAAEAFSDSFIEDPEGFARFFIDDTDSASDLGYEESWNFITEERALSSLHRHTNFNLLLKKLKG